MDEYLEKIRKFNEGLAQMPEWAQFLYGGDNLWDVFLNNGIKALIVGFVGWLIATLFEYRHFHHIRKREKKLKHITLTTTKKPANVDVEVALITGSVMVSHDFFRTLIIMIRKIIGGNVELYERLTARGRREAILRLKAEAQLRGIDHVINLRLNTVRLSARFLSGIAVTVSGTGVKPKH